MKFDQQQAQKQNQVQKLAMTQQLQQSIQILQYSSEELHAYIEAKSLENPLIETQSENLFSDHPISSNGPVYTGDEPDSFNQIPDTHLSLFEYLIDQVHLNYRETFLRSLVLFLVEYIDLNGYLTIDLESAATQMGATEIEMLDALTLLQQLDPAGVGARDLRECLLLQIERDETAPALAYIVLEEEFDYFVDRKWGVIAKKFMIDLSDVQEIFDYVQSLTPSPGGAFETTVGLYIRPDLTAHIQGEEIDLVSNKAGMPIIRFQTVYFERMQATNDKDVQIYLEEKKAEFDWLQRTMQQRGDTILNVGSEIIKQQRAFFLNPSHPLVPMTLKDIAERVGVHESTVSRTVNGKFLETDFGVYELRSFFSNGLANVDNMGEEIATSSVKKYLQELIDKENKEKPLSDQKIVDLLTENKIKISRRTVTKYRESLGIPSSSKRKRYK